MSAVESLDRPAVMGNIAATGDRSPVGKPSSYTLAWIIGPRVDLSCFIGGALAGYGMFALFALTPLDPITVWFVWYVLLDSPHFFGTYSRTYFDREEMQSRRRLLLGSLGLLCVGPALLLLGFVMYKAGSSYYAVPFQALVAFVSTWAYWHVVRQHWGIMALYKRKNKDIDPVDGWVDKIMLYTGLLAPFAAFVACNKIAREMLGLHPEIPASFSWEHAVVNASVAMVLAATALFVGRQMYRYVAGKPINLPKVMFLAAVVPLHVLVCYHSVSMLASLFSFASFVTIFHDIQYHAIVHHYQRNRNHKPGVDGKKFGLSTRISSSFPIYMFCAIGFGLFAGYGACLLNIQQGCMPAIDTASMPIFGSITLANILLSVTIGVLMHHYYVDQFIWRPSKDASLRRDLKLAGA